MRLLIIMKIRPSVEADSVVNDSKLLLLLLLLIPFTITILLWFNIEKYYIKWAPQTNFGINWHVLTTYEVLQYYYRVVGRDVN